MNRQNGLEALFKRLLRVKPDSAIMYIGVAGQFLKNLDIAFCHQKKPAGKVNGPLHT
ncbi:MAG: hypothetical protein LLH30_03325 [Candidatus Manganitrophus sp. SA1]|nr:hypothetical protein [Candidatus Manganitrophus morganii]